MPVIAMTTEIRGARRGDSHGGIFLVDLDGRRGAHVLDWTRPRVDWSGHGGGRGLRGLACEGDDVWVAGADEVFRFSPGFELKSAHASPYLGHAQGLAWFDGRLFVASAAYDSLLSFDPEQGRFDWGLHIVDDDGGLRAIPFDPQGATGPSPGNRLRLDSLSCDVRGLFVAGGRSMGLLHFDGKRIQRVVTLPEGVHDARPWREGVLFNDTEAGVARFLTPDVNCVFEAPLYPEAELEPGSCAEPALARQGYARGLCVLGGGSFAAGSSPLTVSVHDVDTMKTTLRINLSTDARHVPHTLAPWPYPVA